MNYDQAEKLCQTFRRRAPGRELRCRIKKTTLPSGSRMIFEGGKWGPHSIGIEISSRKRAEEHWRGYALANELLAPRIGEIVSFPSPSARSGRRRGKVVKVGPKRVTVTYRFKHGGEAAPKSVPLQDIVFVQRRKGDPAFR